MDHENTPQTPQSPEQAPQKNFLARTLEFFRYNKRLVAVVVIFALAVLSIVFIALSSGNPLYRLRQILHGGNYGTIHFDDSTSNGYANFDDGLAVGTVSGLFTYDLYNRETCTAQNSMSVPLLKTGGNIVLACDIGGSCLCAIDADKGQVLNERLDGTLLDADVSESGAICYALSTKTTKTLLTVLDAEQNETYHWYSETAFFNQCSVSETGSHLVGISLGQQNGAYESSAVIFETDQEEPTAILSLGNEYFLDLDFVSGSTLCAIGEDSAHFFHLNGEQTGVYDYSDTYLTHYDTQADGFIALATNKNRAGGQFTLITLDTSGKELASTLIEDEILDISTAGNYLAVLTTEKLTVYNARLKVCAQTDQISSASQVVARENGSALLISGSEAVLFAG